MLRNIFAICLILPLVSNGEVSNHETKSDSVVIQEKDIKDLKEEINNIQLTSAQEVYDRISARRKQITDRNLLEIYYVVMSYLRVQSNQMSSDDLKKKLNKLVNRLDWLYSDPTKGIFTEKMTNLSGLLKEDVFIHLDHKKMVACLDMADDIKNKIELSNIGNNISPEDGGDLFSSDYFLMDELKVAKQINQQLIDLENTVKGFSDNLENLSKDQIKTKIALANDFINGLRTKKIKVGDKLVNIARNSRKHLSNLASSAIEKLNERNNKLIYEEK